VEEVFFLIARDIKEKLPDTYSKKKVFNLFIQFKDKFIVLINISFIMRLNVCFYIAAEKH